VLSGCPGDLDPRKHGLPTHPAVSLMPERRDESDRELVRRLLDRQMRCWRWAGDAATQRRARRHAFLHLPEDMPRSLPHRDPSGGATATSA